MITFDNIFGFRLFEPANHSTFLAMHRIHMQYAVGNMCT